MAGLATVSTIVVAVLAKADIVLGLTENAKTVAQALALGLVALLAFEGHVAPVTISARAETSNEKTVTSQHFVDTGK
jgi:hypothetical protein